jgi:hypothetical protein
MNFKSIALWAGGAAFVALAFHRYGWQGVAVAVGGIVFWMLLHFTRMMTVMKRAANAPMGYVTSAVMLNAKLKKGVNLLHVMALTRSLGLLQTDNGEQPEVYRWQDNTLSHVTCVFMQGKLQSWALYRPPADSDEAAPAPSASQ